jgi:hypothetical protein
MQVGDFCVQEFPRVPTKMFGEAHGLSALTHGRRLSSERSSI